MLLSSDYQDESQLALDVLDYRSDRLTREDFAMLTKQLGYIAYNLIDIAAHCSTTDSCRRTEAAVALRQVDVIQPVLSQSDLLPAVARLYPLSRTDPSGKYVRCGESLIGCDGCFQWNNKNSNAPSS